MIDLVKCLKLNDYKTSHCVKTGLRAILCSIYYPLLYLSNDKIIRFISEIKTRLLIDLDNIYSKHGYRSKSLSKKVVYEQLSDPNSLDIDMHMYVILSDYFNINIMVLFRNTYYYIGKFQKNRITSILHKENKNNYYIVYPKTEKNTFYPDEVESITKLLQECYPHNIMQNPLQSIQKYSIQELVDMCNIFGIKTTHTVNNVEKRLKKIDIYNELKRLY